MKKLIVIMYIVLVQLGNQSWAQTPNGTLILSPVSIPPYSPSAGVVNPGVTVDAYYTIWADTSSGAPQPSGGWAVTTSAGSKVKYWNHTTGDFDFSQAIYANQHFEGVTAVNALQRVESPTVKYNCFGYATGNTGYWVTDPEPFFTDGDWSSSTLALGDRVLHKKSQSKEHASTLTTETITLSCGGTKTVYKCTGKFGYSGAYKTSLIVADSVYGTSGSYYKD